MNYVSSLFDTVLPEQGANMDPSGLFGLERRPDGMLVALGPDGSRSKWAADDIVADSLASLWIPMPDDISALINEGDSDGALLTAYEWVRNWDMMAPGQMMSVLAVAANGRDIDASAAGFHVAGRPDGLMHLVTPTGRISPTGIRTVRTAELLIDWDGMPAALEIAMEAEDGNPEDAMLARWEAYAAALAAHDVRHAAE